MNSPIDLPAPEAGHSQRVQSEHDDSISTLPLEVFIQIAENLDPEDIARCQMVRRDHFSIFESRPSNRDDLGLKTMALSFLK